MHVHACTPRVPVPRAHLANDPPRIGCGSSACARLCKFCARTVPIFLLPLLLTSVTRSNVEGLSTFRASTPLAPRWRRVTDLFLASPMPPMPGVGGWTHSLNICNRAPWRPFARIEAPIGASPGASASRIAELRRLHVLVAGWVRTKGHDGHGWVAASVHFLCE